MITVEHRSTWCILPVLLQSLLCSDVGRVSHNASSVGQDPSLCVLSTNWWWVLRDGHLIHMSHIVLLVSLQQMVQFGRNPNQGTLLKASQFLAGGRCHIFIYWWTVVTCLAKEELPVRLAHRVKELDELPHNLSTMPSIRKVKNWYAQSFEVDYLSLSCDSIWRLYRQELITAPTVSLPPDIRQALMVPKPDGLQLPESVPNPSFEYFPDEYTGSGNGNSNSNGGGGNNMRLRVPMERRYVQSAIFSVHDWRRQDTTLRRRGSIGLLKLEITIVDSRKY